MSLPVNPGWWDRPVVKTAHIRVWSILAGSLVAVGGVAVVMRLGWHSASLAWTCGTVVVGTWVLCFVDVGAKANLLALRVGVVVSSVVMSTVGLVTLTGPIGYVAAVIVGATHPALLAFARGRISTRSPRASAKSAGSPTIDVCSTSSPGMVDMSAFERMVMDLGPTILEKDAETPAGSPLGHLTTDEICALWRRTFVLLADRDVPVEMVLHVLQVRDQCLQALMVREPAAYRRLIESGTTPARDLGRFFHGTGDTRST